MYRIAVCEDEPNQCTELCKQCREILAELSIVHEIMQFFSAEELQTAFNEWRAF